MLGVFFFFLGGVGIFFQISALYLAAKASSISNGRYGERLWRAVRNYLILLVAIIISTAIFIALYISYSVGRIEAGIAIMIAIGLYGGIAVWQWGEFKKGLRPD